MATGHPTVVVAMAPARVVGRHWTRVTPTQQSRPILGDPALTNDRTRAAKDSSVEKIQHSPIERFGPFQVQEVAASGNTS